MSPSQPISPLAAGRDHVIGVELLDELCRAGDPGKEPLLVRFGKGTRLVGDLPRENRRILAIGTSRVAVRAADDVTDMVFQEYFAAVRGLRFVELAHVCHESIPACLPRNGIGAAAAPLEILAVSAAPLPGIGEVEHRLHAAFAQFGHQEIKAVEHPVVVDSGSGLEDRFDLRYDPLVPFGTDQDPQVADARSLHAVEFAAQPAAVALGPFGGQQSPVPEIGPHEVAGSARPADEPPLLRPGESRPGAVAASGQSQRAGNKQHYDHLSHGFDLFVFPTTNIRMPACGRDVVF